MCLGKKERLRFNLSKKGDKIGVKIIIIIIIIKRTNFRVYR